RTAHDQPAHQATQRLQHLCRQQAVARTEAADGSGKNALGDPRQQDDQQHLAGANQRIAPGRQQLKLFHYSVSSSCCCNASRVSRADSQASSSSASRALSCACSARRSRSSSLRADSYRALSPNCASTAASFSCTLPSSCSSFSACLLCGASCWRSAAAA